MRHILSDKVPRMMMSKGCQQRQDFQLEMFPAGDDRQLIGIVPISTTGKYSNIPFLLGRQAGRYNHCQ